MESFKQELTSAMDSLSKDLTSAMEELTSMLEGASEEIRKKVNEVSEGGSIVDGILGFVHAVDWTEKWIWGVLGLHILLLFFALFFRKSSNTQVGIFCFSLLSVYCAEIINGLGEKYWELFSKQKYFDKNGVFMSVMWSGPLLLISVVNLVNMMLSLTDLMVKWKRAELKHKHRESKRKEE